MWWPCVPSRSPQGSLTGRALTSFPHRPRFKRSAVIPRWGGECHCSIRRGMPHRGATKGRNRVRIAGHDLLRLCGGPKVATSVQLIELQVSVLVQLNHTHSYTTFKARESIDHLKEIESI